MSASLHVPLSVSAKTREELVLELLKIQAQEGGVVPIVSIYFDTDKKEHVLWYKPIKYYGNGAL